ncbi:MAG: hypothetical protein HZC49_10410 [Nitrospirae bacterium]|nr:hypothetical protein [Nitrospirota bacterium]
MFTTIHCILSSGPVLRAAMLSTKDDLLITFSRKLVVVSAYLRIENYNGKYCLIGPACIYIIVQRALRQSIEKNYIAGID